jgi:hypothetical protein
MFYWMVVVFHNASRFSIFLGSGAVWGVWVQFSFLESVSGRGEWTHCSLTALVPCVLGADCRWLHRVCRAVNMLLFVCSSIHICCTVSVAGPRLCVLLEISCRTRSSWIDLFRLLLEITYFHCSPEYGIPLYRAVWKIIIRTLYLCLYFLYISGILNG